MLLHSKKLKYAKTEIIVPEKCVAKSEYEILDCNGFSVQWLFLNDEMMTQNVQEKLFIQLEKQIKFKNKKPIVFISQRQPFSGQIYTMKNGSNRIIAFGRVNNILLILNLGFSKTIKENKDLTDFEKQFIELK